MLMLRIIYYWNNYSPLTGCWGCFAYCNRYPPGSRTTILWVQCMRSYGGNKVTGNKHVPFPGQHSTSTAQFEQEEQQQEETIQQNIPAEWLLWLYFVAREERCSRLVNNFIASEFGCGAAECHKLCWTGWVLHVEYVKNAKTFHHHLSTRLIIVAGGLELHETVPSPIRRM